MSPDLLQVLRPAFERCKYFHGVCRDHCRWEPEHGHVPRGFVGATGSLDDVMLVLVTAEPGDPADGETYAIDGGDAIAKAARYYYEYLAKDSLTRRGRPAPFHEGMRHILNACWPGMSLDEQLRRTWITDAVLCSARVSGGAIPRAVEEVCVDTYLKPQVSLLGHAYVMTLGGKARRRLSKMRVSAHGHAQHPSARRSTNPKASWESAGAAFRAWFETQLTGFAQATPAASPADARPILVKRARPEALVAGPVMSTSAATIRTFAPDAPPDMTFTKVRSFTVDGVPMSRDHRALSRNPIAFKLVDKAVRTIGVDATRQTLTLRDFDGGGTEHYFVEDGGFSVMGGSATEVWRTIFALVRACGMSMEVEFEWRDKPKAAHPGDIGRFSYRP